SNTCRSRRTSVKASAATNVCLFALSDVTGDDTFAARDERGLDTVAHTEPRKAARHELLHRARREMQCGGDLRVRAAVGEVTQHVELARREVEPLRRALAERLERRGA